MSINNKRSYTEYTVTQPTTDFAIGFDDFDEGGKDNILVTLNGVLVESLGYAAIRKNENTVSITPAITEGTVRLTRETDIDEPFHKFTAGALFSAKSMDENFQQVRHSQQEVRDGFVFLEYNTNGIVQASKEATAQAKAATVTATASAVRAETAADTAVQAVGSLQGVVDAATTATTQANTATATANTAASQATAATTSAQNAALAANTAKQEATTAAANANAATVDTLAATNRANDAADVVADLVVGKVRAQDVSTADGSTQDVKNTEFRNELDALPFQEGLLPSTKTTYLSSAIGAVLRSAYDKLSDTVSVKDFGAKGDGVTDDLAAFTKAIAHLASIGGGVLYIPEGVYRLTNTIQLAENVALKGASSSRVKLLHNFNYNNRSNPIISTPIVSENVLTLTSELRIGDITNNISNACKKGDLIRFWSNELFIKRWDSRVIRAYYYEAEMADVKTATPTSVEFSKPVIIDCLLTKEPNVTYFTPNKNMRVTGVTLEKPVGVANYSSGLKFTCARDCFYDDIVTIGFDNAGIIVEKSVNINGGRTHHIGGSADVGLLYGVIFSNGARECYQEVISGDGLRHTVAAGGDGWAVPMYNTVGHIKAVNSLAGAMDTHAVSAYFTYMSANVDVAGVMSGLGHKMMNVVATGIGEPTSHVFGCGEGGKDLTFENIRLTNHARWYSGYGVKDSVFRNITIKSDKFEDLGFTAPNSTGNKFENIKILCTSIDSVASTAEAEALHNAGTAKGLGGFIKQGVSVKGAVIQGFPVGLDIIYTDVNCEDITMLNCGWATSLYSHNGAVTITASNASIRNINIVNTNTSIDWKGTKCVGINIMPNQTVGSDNISVSGFRNTDSSASAVPLEKIRMIAKGTRVTLNEVYLKSQDDVLGVFRPEPDISITNTNLIKQVGTTAERPVRAGAGYKYFDTTLGKPVFFSSNESYPYPSGAVWVDSAGVVV